MTTEEFVIAWVEAVNEGKNQVWLAEKFGVSRQYIAAYAKRLREKGVKLPKMRKTPTKYDSRINVDSLNELIESAK